MTILQWDQANARRTAKSTPHRGKRNEPSYLPLVIDKIAMIKKLPVEEVELALLANARRVWGVL